MKFTEIQNRLRDEQEERAKSMEDIRHINDQKSKLDQEVRTSEKYNLPSHKLKK
jgi:hypothetical protein